MAKVFDASKDVLLNEIGQVEFGDTKLGVSVHSYNQGQPKLQIQRSFKDKFNNLGRLTVEEVRSLIPLLQEFVNKYGKE